MKKEMKIIRKNDPGYQEARVISNLLLLNNGKRSPDEIIYCEKSADVEYALNYCKKEKKLFRIRSGGHHHEGACTGDHLVVIDTSGMNSIVIDRPTSTVIIDTGAQLKNVYKTLEERNLIIPGGGCDNVAIGGLLQGGGWGPYSRLYGMTCDALVSARIIIADEKLGFRQVNVNANEYKDLFKALKGAGGGNFGLVTSYTLKAYSLNELEKRSFTIKISNEKKPREILNKWFKNAAGAINEITSFARVYPDSGQSAERPPLVISGFIIVSKNENLQVTKRKVATIISPDFPLDWIDIPTTVLKNLSNTEDLPSMENSISTDVLINNDTLTNALNQVSTAPQSTCLTPLPHKISSFFPKKGINYEILSNTIFDYMAQNHNLGSQVSSYLSLHGMGGEIRRGDNSFFYKDRDFMFQVQAWWSDSEDPDNEKYLAWVENLRSTLDRQGFTEGCFVNFPDYNCIRPSTEPGKNWKYDPKNDVQRRELLLKFYGKFYLFNLLQTKQKYDIDNNFSHEMSLISRLQKNDWIDEFEESNADG